MGVIESPEHVLAAGPISMADVERIARGGARVVLDPHAKATIDRTRRALEEKATGDEAIYGVNTGFGSLAHVRIEPERTRELQRNLLRSHAAGVGEPLPTEAVRAMLFILAANLARGRSGVRSILIERILDLLNRDVVPVVPSRGSVGASGDLAPLAHASLVLIGEGRATLAATNGERVEHAGGDALRLGGMEPIQLEAKEGLALINGTHLMTALGVLALGEVGRLVDAAVAAAALAMDACRATDEFLDARLHESRNQPGQVAVAARLRALLGGSQIVQDHKVDDPRVQDPYCLRAAPQVLGAVLDTIDVVSQVFARELGAVTDNPLVFTGDTPASDVSIISGGNFHGMPLAIALDTLSIALCHLAGIAERRINWLLTASDRENPINPYLSPDPGFHSGLMMVQYTAAACCNELQTLATPASTGNIPTSAGVEDYNSMGVTAAHQVTRGIDLVRQVIAIELLVMAEALEYQRPLRSGEDVEATHATIRTVVPRLTSDRPPSPDIASIAELIRAGSFSD